MAFAPVRKPYRIGLLTPENDDFRAISATKRNCAVPVSNGESQISDRCLYYNGYLSVRPRKATRYCWFVRDLTAAMLVVKNKKHFSPLGTKLNFHVNSSRKYSFVLTPNMAALSRGCKPRIV